MDVSVNTQRFQPQRKKGKEWKSTVLDWII